MALELGGSTVFDDSAASRRHPNVSFGEPPVVAQYPPVPIRLIHSPIGREVQASFRVEGQQQRRQSHPVVRQPFPHGSDSSHKNAADWSGGECQIERRSKRTESNVQPFEFRGNPVATVTAENGTVLFCAKHVATALGYSNTNDAIRKHCRHIDGVANRYPITDSLGRTQQAVFLTEGDVYRLIASSKLPSAVEFEHWLFDEVVPQIRRTGGYIPQGETPEETMARAVLIAQRTIEDQKKQLEAQRPKVLFADAVATSKRSILIGELAKILKQNGVKTGQNRLFKQLREDGFLMKRNGNPNMPTQKSMELGLFEVKETSIAHSDGHVSLNFTTKVTSKGQQYLIQRYLGCTPLDLEAGA